jgi:hypothetical protein
LLLFTDMHVVTQPFRASSYIKLLSNVSLTDPIREKTKTKAHGQAKSKNGFSTQGMDSESVERTNLQK